MNINLSDDQADLLSAELDRIIEGDKFPLSPRIRTLREIRGMIKPYPVREPLPPLKSYEPPRVGRGRRR